MSISPFRNDQRPPSSQTASVKGARAGQSTPSKIQQLTTKIKSVANAALGIIGNFGKLLGSWKGFFARKTPKGNDPTITPKAFTVISPNRSVANLRARRKESREMRPLIPIEHQRSDNFEESTSKFRSANAPLNANHLQTSNAQDGKSTGALEPGKLERAIFESSFPHGTVTTQDVGTSMDALSQLELDLHRSTICIQGVRILSLEEFSSALRGTPFENAERPVAEMLSQTGMAPSYDFMQKYATDQINLQYPLEAPKNMVLFQNSFDAYHVDFAPAKDPASGSWEFRGEMSFKPVAISDAFLQGVELAPKITLQYTARISPEWGGKELWNDVKVAHFLSLSDTASVN